MSHAHCQVLDPNCPQRLLLEQITDKWSLLILIALEEKPLRFNALKRRLAGVTQKALTQSVRRLERNGLVARLVLPVSPIAVEYRLTPLGGTLLPHFLALYAWLDVHLPHVEQARQEFDNHAARETISVESGPAMPAESIPAPARM